MSGGLVLSSVFSFLSSGQKTVPRSIRRSASRYRRRFWGARTRSSSNIPLLVSASFCVIASPAQAEEVCDDQPAQIPREGQWGGGGGRSCHDRRRSERHRAAEGSVANVHDLDSGARRAPRGGAAASEGR